MLAVLRIEKFKDFGKLGAAGGHLDRSRTTLNADPSRLVDNRWLKGSPDLVNLVKERIAQRVIGKNGKQRKVADNAILALDVVMSASPEYFRPGRAGEPGIYDTKRVNDFEKACLKWLQKEFGIDNVVSVITHLDEITPHIHAVIVPLTPKGNLKAQHWIQGGKKLSALQTRFAENLAHLGIQRGKEKSTATHQRVGSYYENVNAVVTPDVEPVLIKNPPFTLTKSKRNGWAVVESQRINTILQPVLQPLADKAKEYDSEHERRIKAEEEAKKLRWKLERDRVRDIPLTKVFEICGYQADPRNEHQFKTDCGRISIDAIKQSKFFNHDLGTGGGGAIDLAMHLQGFTMAEACDFLAAHYDIETIAKAAAYKTETDIKVALSEKPKPDEAQWRWVRDYLVNTRRLSGKFIDYLHSKMKVYSDSMANCCFKYGNRGVELRGTRGKFHGFRGSKKVPFCVGRSDTKKVALVESAIEAMSLVELMPEFAAISTSGTKSVESLAAIAKDLEKQGCKVYAAFNNDQAGDRLAQSLISELSSVERIKPSNLRDWNNELISSKEILPSAAEKILNNDSYLKPQPC